MPHRILIITSSLFLIAILSVFLFWHLLGGETVCREGLLNYIRPVTSDSLKAEKLVISPGSLRLINVKVPITANVDLSIAEFYLKLSLSGLLLNGIKSPGVIEEIRFDTPVLLIKSGHKSSTGGSDEQRQKLRISLKENPYIFLLQKILIQNGKIVAGTDTMVIADNIDGHLAAAVNERLILSMAGRMFEQDNIKIEIDGEGNLDTGEFLVAVTSSVDDLHYWSGIIKRHDFVINKGKADLVIQLRGADDMRLSGSAEIEDFEAIYKDRLTISSKKISGDLFGSEVSVNTDLSLNGFEFPVELVMGNLPDLSWRLAINRRGLDLKKVDLIELGLPHLSGFVNLTATGHGDLEGWSAETALHSDEFRIDTLLISDFDINAIAHGNTIGLKRIAGQFEGGEFTGTGSYGIITDSLWMSGAYSRKWEAGGASWSAINSPGLSLKGFILRSDDTLRGEGSGELTDNEGRIFAHGKLRATGKELQAVITAPEKSGWLEIVVVLGDKVKPYRVSSLDPHIILSEIIDTKKIPEFLHNYVIDFNAEGKPDSVTYTIDMSDLDQVRELDMSGRIRNLGGRWDITSDLEMSFRGDGEKISGAVQAGYVPGKIDVSVITLTNSLGSNVLDLKTSYDIAEKRFDSFFFRADSLPFLDIIDIVMPLNSGVSKGLLSGTGIDMQDSILLNLNLSLLYPDTRELLGDVDFIFEPGSYFFRNIEIQDADDDIRRLTLSGRINQTERCYQSLILNADEFESGRLISIFNRDIAQKFGGNLNGRFEIDGPFDDPSIATDFHLSNGLINGIKDYWANFSVITSDSGYLLKDVNLGKGVSGLFSIKGMIDRKTGDIRLGLASKEVPMEELVETATGKPSFIKGKCWIEGSIAGVDKPQSANFNLKSGSGMIGPLSFDSLKASFRIEDISSRDARIFIEDAEVDWGTCSGHVSGTIPLTNTAEIEIKGEVNGELLSLLRRLDNFFSDTKGDGSINFQIGGNLKHPRIIGGEFILANGAMRLNEVVNKFENLNVQVSLDSSGRITFDRFDGLGNGHTFSFANRFPENDTLEEAIIVGDYNFGIVQFVTAEDGLWANIPSLMKDDWRGYFRFSGPDNKGFFEFSGPASQPRAKGEIRLRNTTLTYPFITTGKKPSAFVRGLLAVLEKIRWNARVIPERNNHYSRELSGFGEIPGLNELSDDVTGSLIDFDVKLYLDLLIDDSPDGLFFSGAVKDSLRIKGELTSQQGTVEYLDMEFDVDKIGILFNPPELEPLFYGGIKTEVFDSLNIPREVRLKIKGIGSEEERLEGSVFGSGQSDRGRWDEIMFVFEDDQGHSQEQILAMMGYSPEQLPDKLIGLGGKLVSDATPLRRWTRTFERQVERFFGVDRVDISPRIAQNLIEMQLYPEEYRLGGDNSGGYLRTLDQTQVTVGKYLTKEIYLSYTGSLLSGTDAFNVTRIGVVHNWDVMFRLYHLAPSLTLNYRYKYDNLAQKDDSSIYLRYSFFVKF